jgi:hypothetical protein
MAIDDVKALLREIHEGNVAITPVAGRLSLNLSEQGFIVQQRQPMQGT